MLNLSLGGSFPVLADISAFVVGAEIGVALDDHRNAYIVLPVQAQFSASATTMMVGIGFQVDVRLPIPGLYLYPRLVGGYAAIVPYDMGDSRVGVATVNAGFLLPELGLKLVVKRRYNIGLSPLGFPIFFAQDDQGNTLTRIAYRCMAYLGVNF